MGEIIKRVKRRKIILICLVILISGVTALIGLNIYKKIENKRKINQINYVSTIDKKNLVFDVNAKLQYYYKIKPNVTEEDRPSWLDYTAKYSINSDGLNERFNYPVIKDKDTFRIVALGDSFTFGNYVNTEDNWTEKLEDLLNTKLNNCTIKKFEIINLGMRGFDIPYITERYKLIGTKYNPDLIIWLESGSGFVRLNEIEQPLVNQCEIDKKNNLTVNSDPSTLYSCWNEAEKQIVKSFSKEQIASYLGNYIDSFLKLVYPVKVNFFAFTNLGEIYSLELKDWLKNHPNATVSFDLPNLSKSSALLPDGHPNIKGQTIIAETIFKELEKDILYSVCNNNL